jgi:hypothetical protein
MTEKRFAPSGVKIARLGRTAERHFERSEAKSRNLFVFQ